MGRLAGCLFAVVVQEEIDRINARRFAELEKKLANDMDSFGRAQTNAAVIQTERIVEAADKEEVQHKNKQTATQRYMTSLEWNQRYSLRSNFSKMWGVNA